MIIADTGAFVALFNQKDTFHPLAEPSFSRCSEPLITTYPVLAETCYLISQIVSRAAEQKFLETEEISASTAGTILSPLKISF